MNFENRNGQKGMFDFSSIPNGEVFRYEDDYYLAIDVLEDDCCNRVNAINLSEGDGEASYFEDDTIVLWVKTTLIVESR